VLTGFDHVICLGLAGGVAPIVTEAGTLQELSELSGLGVRQGSGDLDAVILIHDSHRPESASMWRRHAST
jgi:hypothetical protein